MSKYPTAAERIGRLKLARDPNFDLDGFLKKSEIEAFNRHAAIDSFVQEIKDKVGLEEHRLSKMAQHFFYSPLCPASQSEAALKQFAHSINSGDDGLPMLIVDRWVSSECANMMMAHSVLFEVTRLAREDGIELPQADINEPPVPEAAPYFQTALNSSETASARDAYSENLEQANHLFREWASLQLREVSPDKKKQLRVPALLPQPTFYEARSGATAISDGRDLRDWNAIEGMMAMLHAPKDSIMQTRFEPCSLLLGWWGKPTGAELKTLQCELQKLEFDALVTYFVCLSWAVEEYQVTASLDSIIDAIGRGTDARRSAKARQELRAKVWRWLLLFDSLAVIGARPGTWKEPRDGNKKREKIDPDKLYSRDALLKIIGSRATEQGTFDNSAPPKEVTFVAGAWVNQFRGNREMLSDFGNVRAIASIPRGKPRGAWAACIGFALNQKWREQAAKAPVTRITKGDKKAITQKFRPFTRRVLLAQLWRSDVDPEEILKSDHPERAKEYWEAAIALLKKDGIIGIYQEIEPVNVTGYGWQDEWLDQPLDIRPHGDSRKDAIEIHQSAEAARKRTRKKTTPKDTPKTD